MPLHLATSKPADTTAVARGAGSFVSGAGARTRMEQRGEHRLYSLLRSVASDRDRGAFAELFAFFAPRIKAFLRRGGVNADLAEELAQEAMIQVWRRAESYDPAHAAVSTWIFAIARNKRIDRLRREARPEIDEDEYAATLPPPVRSDE